MAAAKRAVEIAPDLAESRTSLGFVQDVVDVAERKTDSGSSVEGSR
jgi:hypothetical protein